MDVVRQKPLAKVRALPKVGIVAAVIGAAVLALVVSLRPSGAATSVERTSTWTERVKRGDLVREVPVQGRLVPEHLQWLSAATAARVARIAVKPGAEVEPDTVVVVLENTDLELAAIEASRQAASAESRLIEVDVKGTSDEKAQAAAMAVARTELSDADRHLGTANRLAPEGLVSENERRDMIARAAGLAERYASEEAKRTALVDGRSRTLAAQRAELERIREIAAFRRRQLAALEIRAGVRGVVQDIPLENGQWVAIGTTLAKIAEPGRLKAEVKVAETHAGQLQNGLAVRFEGTGRACRGKIARIDPAVAAGNVRVEVTLDELPAGARVDQMVSGYVEVDKLANVLYVARPSGALDNAAAGVFRLDADRAHATRVPVQLGRGSVRDVEVVSGLAEGDEIVVSDVSAWDASTRVRLK